MIVIKSANRHTNLGAYQIFHDLMGLRYQSFSNRQRLDLIGRQLVVALGPVKRTNELKSFVSSGGMLLCVGPKAVESCKRLLGIAKLTKGPESQTMRIRKAAGFSVQTLNNVPCNEIWIPTKPAGRSHFAMVSDAVTLGTGNGKAVLTRKRIGKGFAFALAPDFFTGVFSLLSHKYIPEDPEQGTCPPYISSAYTQKTGCPHFVTEWAALFEHLMVASDVYLPRVSLSPEPGCPLVLSTHSHLDGVQCLKNYLSVDRHFRSVARKHGFTHTASIHLDTKITPKQAADLAGEAKHDINIHYGPHINPGYIAWYVGDWQNLVGKNLPRKSMTHHYSWFFSEDALQESATLPRLGEAGITLFAHEPLSRARGHGEGWTIFFDIDKKWIGSPFGVGGGLWRPFTHEGKPYANLRLAMDVFADPHNLPTSKPLKKAFNHVLSRASVGGVMICNFHSHGKPGTKKVMDEFFAHAKRKRAVGMSNEEVANRSLKLEKLSVNCSRNRNSIHVKSDHLDVERPVLFAYDPLKKLKVSGPGANAKRTGNLFMWNTLPETTLEIIAR